MSRRIYYATGQLFTWSHIDDLQSLRDMIEYPLEKVPNPDFPDWKQKTWDINTLPFIKGNPNYDKIESYDDKSYSVSMGEIQGYVLSTMKKMLEVIDNLQVRILELENKE